jgi:hypothetical protein
MAGVEESRQCVVASSVPWHPRQTALEKGGERERERDEKGIRSERRAFVAELGKRTIGDEPSHTPTLWEASATSPPPPKEKKRTTKGRVHIVYPLFCFERGVPCWKKTPRDEA